jgi:pimeloyl-ACP methyl ester carboxylesterase
MAATSPIARLVEVPEVGHAPTLSEPEAREAILALLERVR